MRRFFVPVLLVCLGGLASGFSSAAYETVVLAADEWCPYTCAEDALEPGFMVEIANRAFKPYNIHVQYKVMSWARAIEQARAGKIDGIIGAAHGDAPDFIFPEMLQGVSSMQFWVRKDSSWVYDSIAALDRVKIGIATDYSYGKVLDLYLKVHATETSRIQAVTGQSPLTVNLQKLTTGTIDVLPQDKSVMQYYFVSHNLPVNIKSAGIVTDGENVDDNYLYIAFGPNKPKAQYYADLMNKRMAEMRRSGELHEILARYKIDDWYRAVGK